jgi:protease IV
MKQFLKFTLASIFGFLISAFILIFILIAMITSIASMSSKDTTIVPQQSVLHLNFDNQIVDRGSNNPFDGIDYFSISASAATGLNDVLKNLKKAANDDNISGIFLDLTMLNAGWATTSELRQALTEFKESDKFIICYAEVLTQRAYYLASVADEIYLNPEGAIDFRGINAETIFIKNMLDKLGIDPQLVRHGKYKSAGESLFLTKMSEESREQVLAYIGSIWNNTLADIATSRGLTINHLNDVANDFATRTAEGALEAKMIDGIKHRDELLSLLNEKLGQEENKKISFVSHAKYTNAPMPKNMVTSRSREKIAVIYASGNILSGSGSDRSIGSDGMAKAIREARQDTTVKAIVFRINSPGGSALASDVILREVKLASAVKPVIASMGDMAASGGYYIACGADKIMASPNTITGSIGVFGMLPNMQHFFNNKLGITFDNVKTNDLADFGSLARPMTAREREVIQGGIEAVYETFIGHVAEGRSMPVDVIDDLGQGRVWSGAEARQNGLVDEFGGLNDAIKLAADMSELSDYRIVEYPHRKDFFTQLIEDLGGVHERMIENRLGAAYHYYKQVEELNQMTGILARMPYDITLE